MNLFQILFLYLIANTCIMKTLDVKQDAKLRNYKVAATNVVPLISWGFSSVYQNEIKNAVLDLKKINILSVDQKWVNDVWDFQKQLEEKVVIITDDKLNIVFASHNMYKMNGYLEKEVLGKSPKMFQGKETSFEISSEIREAIAYQKPFLKKVLNYKKRGQSYYCLIEGFPVFNKNGDLVNFIAFEQAA